MPQIIPLTQGRVAIVSPEDYEELAKYKWYCALGYAVRNVGEGDKRRQLRMHRVLLDALLNSTSIISTATA